MDVRDLNHKWYVRFDERRMVLVVEDVSGEEVEVPAKYDVCPVCNGKGRHVNPNIDRQGLTATDFAEDPDLAESYFSGTYDVPCAACHGERVVPEVDADRATEAERQAANTAWGDHMEGERSAWYEREHGY